MGFVPPPIYEPGYPGGMGPNFKRWLRDRQRDRIAFVIATVLGIAGLVAAVVFRIAS